MKTVIFLIIFTLRNASRFNNIENEFYLSDSNYFDDVFRYPEEIVVGAEIENVHICPPLFEVGMNISLVPKEKIAFNKLETHPHNIKENSLESNEIKSTFDLESKNNSEYNTSFNDVFENLDHKPIAENSTVESEENVNLESNGFLNKYKAKINNESENFDTEEKNMEFELITKTHLANVSLEVKTLTTLNNQTHNIVASSENLAHKNRKRSLIKEELDCKRHLNKRIKYLNEKYKKNASIEETNRKIIEKSSIFKSFDYFLTLFEDEFKTFLTNMKYSSTVNVEKILYSRDLIGHFQFSSKIFGDFDCEEKTKLEKLSSTAHILMTFLNTYHYNKNISLRVLIATLGIKGEKTPQTVNVSIQHHINNFLESEESNYFKSIVPEFYSFSEIYNQPDLMSNFETVKGFICFLIMIKRNAILINELIYEINNSLNFDCAENIFMKETKNNFAFFYVFLSIWPWQKNSKNIIQNFICYVQYSFTLEKIVFKLINSKHIHLFSILRYLFFYLQNLNLKVESPEIFKEAIKNEISSIYNRNSKVEIINTIENIQKILKEKLESISDISLTHKPNVFDLKLLKNIINNDNSLNAQKLYIQLYYSYSIYLYCDFGVNTLLDIYENRFDQDD